MWNIYHSPWRTKETQGLRLCLSEHDPCTLVTMQREQTQPEIPKPIGPDRNLLPVPQILPLCPCPIIAHSQLITTHIHPKDMPTTVRPISISTKLPLHMPLHTLSYTLPPLTIQRTPILTSTLPTEVPLLSMLSAAFSFLKHSAPNLTQYCWPCLGPKHPYYVGMAYNLLQHFHNLLLILVFVPSPN